MNQPGDDNLLVQARSTLLDALDALDQHRDSLIVIGAQAVYLRSGAAVVALAESTKDSDLAINPHNLKNDPHLEEAMTQAGFYLNANNLPGAWVSADGIPVDLMVPHGLSNRTKKKARSPRLPPHDNMALRIAVGLEGCVVDNSLMTIPSLDENDERSRAALVAGPAALIVAKIHKIHERQGSPDRLQNKDAHDLYRLLVAHETEDLAVAFGGLLANPISKATTEHTTEWMRELFATPTALGSVMAGKAEEGIGNPTQVAAATSILVEDLLFELGGA